LQVRSEERDTVYNRQLNGRIDRRLVSALGYDYQNVFYTKEVDKFKKIILHISLDASGSMAGDRWRQAMTTAIAICKAATMVNNLDVQLSVRSTIDGGSWNNSKPYMVIAYDSRTDKFTKVKQLVAALEPNGTTPEGLCFEAIMKHFTESTNDLESYFLNISDGEPNFGNDSINYSRQVASKHTAEMVKRIKQRGIGVLSYFVSDYTPYESSKKVFSEMYGKDAKFIDVNGLVPITKTLNELFLKK
jgi:nitric oxide reductase activation protein